MKTILMLFMTFNVSAETFELAGNKIDLPIKKEWLTKAPRKDALVFFDAKLSNPRPIITVSTSPFKFPANLSEFEGIYKSKKLEWIQEVEAKQLFSPKFDYNKNKKSVVVRYGFEVNNIKFQELSSYQECGSIGYQIKIMQAEASPYAESDKLLSTIICP